MISGPSEIFTDTNEGVGMGIPGDNKTHKHREAVIGVPGGQELELIEFIDPKPMPIPSTAATLGKVHFSFKVEDIMECYSKLKSFGIEPFSAPNECDYESGPGYWMYLRDPNGIIFELQQM